MSTCPKCHGDGYVCVICDMPPDDCECEEEDDGESVPLNVIETRRCVCNPRRRPEP